MEALMPDTPDAVVRSWFEELWNGGKEETIDRLYAADGIAHGLPSPDGSPIRGREAFRPFFKSFRSAFPDIRVEVTQTVSDGDMVAALCHVTGTHQGHDIGITATGKSVDFSGMVFARVHNGLIVEAWNSFDFLSLYRQVGFLPL
jgi:steroid delta-isomerase-like uncharacterized protein